MPTFCLGIKMRHFFGCGFIKIYRVQGGSIIIINLLVLDQGGFISIYHEQGGLIIISNFLIHIKEMKQSVK